MNLLTIRLPGNDYPHMNCIVKEGDPADLTKKLVFTTKSKAGVERQITCHPNGVIVEEVLNEE